ncbi:MAG: hypothetical protein ABL971_13680 [Vicinamibacterales bacterium]
MGKRAWGVVLLVVSVAAGSAVVLQGARAATSPVFQLDPFWPKTLPNQWILGMISGLFVDSRDHIWVLQRPSTVTEFEASADGPTPAARCCRRAPPVLEFDQAGTLIQSWGGPGEGYEWPVGDQEKPRAEYQSRGPFGEHTLALDHHNSVWLGSNGPGGTVILKFSRAGKFLMQIGKAGQNSGSNDTQNLGGPAGIAVDPATNEVFVADGYVNRRIAVFDAETGKYQRHWGAYGKPPDDSARPPRDAVTPPPQFSTPHCVKISNDGLVYVCDRGNSRIQVFRKDGTFVREQRVAAWATRGSAFDIGFSPDPKQQFLYMLDGRDSRVWILRRETLEVLNYFGHGGHQAGGFTGAHNLAVDSRHNIYVGEALEGKRVQRFVYKGMGPANPHANE